uniref:Uncharacterized protein n=1 Tax=Cacopsylla melanoneura TaxID=428564 RepID=A0A8D9E7R3_9HEMI
MIITCKQRLSSAYFDMPFMSTSHDRKSWFYHFHRTKKYYSVMPLCLQGMIESHSSTIFIVLKSIIFSCHLCLQGMIERFESHSSTIFIVLKSIILSCHYVYKA